ncbi:hypothetical protein R1flu_012338 [Riccia fluitans]|uniref:HMA domain-containing protein n=1 Tax=Riccia fluitans TaxID=41844 RepID=A0ABD1ZAB9_9MARC
MNPNISLIKIELKVPLCCQDCEETVRVQLGELEGVKDVNVDLSIQKVIVIGHNHIKLEPSTVLNSVKKVKNRAQLWIPSRII